MFEMSYFNCAIILITVSLHVVGSSLMFRRRLNDSLWQEKACLINGLT